MGLHLSTTRFRAAGLSCAHLQTVKLAPKQKDHAPKGYGEATMRVSGSTKREIKYIDLTLSDLRVLLAGLRTNVKLASIAHETTERLGYGGSPSETKKIKRNWLPSKQNGKVGERK
jgi:hypothetical protein